MSAASEKLSSSARIDESLDATAAALTSLAGTEVGFAAVAQQLPLTIIVLDRELRVRWINGVAAESVNLRADEAIGAHWPSIARGPADRFANYERVLAGELVEVSDVTVPRDDTTSHYRGLCRPMRSPTGDIVGILIVGEDVTAQRTAEKALAESERRFRMLAEQSRDIVAVVSTQGELLYVNHATMQILGYAPEEVMGRSGFEMVHPDDAARVRGRLRAVLTEGPDRTPQSVEYRVRHKDGSWRWLETLPAILSEDPEGHSVLTASRDVTERRRAEDALRLSQERYRLAIRAMNGVIYEWNVATGRVLRTPGLGDWLELPENAVPADIDSWLARVHPDERLAQDEICALLLRDGQFESSYRIQTASGDYARLWERSILVRDAQGRPERVIGFIVDRTEASRTQALLEATEETAAIGGWEQNFLTGQIYWTDRVFRLHGIEPDASGCYYEDTRRFFAPSSIPLIEAAIDAARSRGIPFDVETKMVSATGRIWWARIVAQVERDGDGRSVRAYGAIQDITERKQAEIEIVAKSGWLEVALSTAQMSAWRLDLVSGTIYQAARSSLLRRMIVEPHTLESLFDAIHPADRQGVVEAIERARQVDDTYDVEYRTRMADGSWAYKHSFGRLERDAAGQAIALIGATQDITDRRRVETALRASESTLRQVTQHSSDSITLLDRELRIRFTNRSVSGLSPEALEGRYLAEFLPEDRSATVLGCLRRVLATGRPDSYALEYAAELGGMRHYEFRVSPIADGAAISGLVVNGSDVTRHILAERAIATQARMIDSMLEGVAVVDGAWRIEITNPAFDALFGWPRGTLHGTEIGVLANSPDGSAAFWRPESARRMAVTEVLPIEFDAQRADGSVVAVAGIVTPFEVAGESHRLVVLQDVSERRALEREILEAGSREQQRIGADLHDGLGQELTGIALMLKSVSGRLAVEYPRLLPEVEGITRLVSDAIESTRSLARGLSPVALERGGLVDALEGLAMQARAAYRVDVTFQHRLKKGTELDEALADHLYRIAQEALANAMRHGRAGCVAIRLTTRGARIRLQVADDGIGLPARATEASGLGLRLMRYRARMTGGEVRFERNGRRGTRVICECPLRRHRGSHGHPSSAGSQPNTAAGSLEGEA